MARHLASKARCLPLAFPLVSLVASCSEEHARGGHSFSDGSPLAGAKAIVSVRYLSNGPRECVGVLVGSRHVLTARHCVADTTVGSEGQKGSVLANPSNVLVRMITASGQPERRLQRIVELHPERDERHWDSVLLLLTEPADVAPIQISDRPVVPGMPFSVLGLLSSCGHSRCSTERAFYARAADARVDCVGKECPAAAKPTQWEWMGGSGPCPGDSGAPATDADGLLLGIVLRGRIDASARCVDTVFQDLPSIRGYIHNLISTADKDSPPLDY